MRKSGPVLGGVSFCVVLVCFPPMAPDSQLSSAVVDGSSFTVTSLDPPNLFDIQFCCLGATFLRGSSLGPAGWIAVGTGLRKAMDVGAHRKKVYKSTPNADDELWKRAFW